MDQVIINVSSSELLDKIMVGSEDVVLKIQQGVLANWQDKNLRPKVDEEVAKQLLPKLDKTINGLVRATITEHFKYEELEPLIRQETIKIINRLIDDELGKIIEEKVQELFNKKVTKALKVCK